MTDYWSYILSAVGLVGFYLAGRKVWWCWYVNIANQVLWVTYALVSDQYGFLIAAAGYSVVFIKNAYSWTREHFSPPEQNGPIIGQIVSLNIGPEGLSATGELFPNFDSEMFMAREVRERSKRETRETHNA